MYESILIFELRKPEGEAAQPRSLWLRLAARLRKQPAEEPLELTDVLPLALGLACGGALFDGCP